MLNILNSYYVIILLLIIASLILILSIMKLTSTVFKRKCEYYHTWFFVFFIGLALDTFYCCEIYLDSQFVAHKRYFLFRPDIDDLSKKLSVQVYNFSMHRITQSMFNTEFSYFKDFILSCNDRQLQTFYNTLAPFPVLSELSYYAFINSIRHENSK